MNLFPNDTKELSSDPDDFELVGGGLRLQFRSSPRARALLVALTASLLVTVSLPRIHEVLFDKRNHGLDGWDEQPDSHWSNIDPNARVGQVKWWKCEDPDVLSGTECGSIMCVHVQTLKLILKR